LEDATISNSEPGKVLYGGIISEPMVLREIGMVVFVLLHTLYKLLYWKLTFLRPVMTQNFRTICGK
jgi:hypothetical protein